MRKISLMMLAGVGILFLPGTLKAQEGKDKVVILSPRVGAVIDAAEREYFKLFEGIKDFETAVIYKTADGSFYAKITLLPPSAGRQRMVLQYSREDAERYLLSLCEQIEHFEEIEAGRYHIGEKPCDLHAWRTEELEVLGDRQIPPLNAGRVVGELLAGAATGVALAIPVGLAGRGDLGVAVAAFVLAIPLGTSLGVYIVGSLGNETGSYPATLAGCLIGGGVGLLAGINTEDDTMALLATPIGALLGATVGFNLSRKLESAQSTGALLTFSDGQARLGLRSTYLRIHPIDGKPVRTVDLVRVEF